MINYMQTSMREVFSVHVTSPVFIMKKNPFVSLEFYTQTLLRDEENFKKLKCIEFYYQTCH